MMLLKWSFLDVLSSANKFHSPRAKICALFSKATPQRNDCSQNARYQLTLNHSGTLSGSKKCIQKAKQLMITWSGSISNDLYVQLDPRKQINPAPGPDPLLFIVIWTSLKAAEHLSVFSVWAQDVEHTSDGHILLYDPPIYPHGYQENIL